MLTESVPLLKWSPCVFDTRMENLTNTHKSEKKKKKWWEVQQALNKEDEETETSSDDDERSVVLFELSTLLCTVSTFWLCVDILCYYVDIRLSYVDIILHVSSLCRFPHPKHYETDARICFVGEERGRDTSMAYGYVVDEPDLSNLPGFLPKPFFCSFVVVWLCGLT